MLHDPITGRFLFSPETEGGNADAGGNSGEGADGKPNPKPAGEKTFTQAEVDELIKSRLDRAKAKFSDYDTVKSRLTELEREAQTRQQQDLEAKGKYEEALQHTEKRYKTELEKLAADREQWQQRYEGLAIDNAVLVEAQKHNALDPQDVLALVRSHVKLGADGVPSFDDGKSIADGVKAFLDAKPHLVKASSRGGSGTNHQTGAPGVGDKPLSGMSPAEIRALGGRDIIARVGAQSGGLPWSRKGSEK